MDTGEAIDGWSGRSLTWFDAERGRLYCAAAALVFVGVLAGLLLWGLDAGYTKGGQPFGMDFASFWAESRLIRAGMATAAYIPELHKLAEMVVIPPGDYEAFFYPPPYLLLCAPLAALPFFWSLAAFMGVTGIAFGAAVSRAAVSPWVVVAALVSPALLNNLVVGQNAMLTAAILGGGLTLMDRRPKLAGAILGLMVVKPHLALAVPIALMLSRRWTVLGFAALSAATFVMLSTAVFGWEIWPAFIGSMTNSRHALEAGLVQFHLIQSSFAMAQMLGFNVRAAYALQGLTIGVALGALIWTRMKRVSPAVERSVVVLASLLVTPFILHYDLLILVFPAVWLLTQWADEGFPPWGKLVLLSLYLLPIAIFAFPDAHFGLAGMLGLTAYLMVVERHAAPNTMSVPADSRSEPKDAFG